MKEMMVDDNLYQILGIKLDATSVQIKEAYRYKAVILHPDRLASMPDKFRARAEEDLKKVNAAYEILSDPNKRQQYDRIMEAQTPENQSSRQAPRPCSASDIPAHGHPRYEVYPKHINLNNALVNVPEHGAFFVESSNGPFTNVCLASSKPWLKVIRTTALGSGGSSSVMRVDIEGIGYEWNQNYAGVITVKLDRMQAEVKVKLRTLRF
ncbi:MAG: J domain-containing protein [Dehalococcoidia bacterium]|nr:J domain-containing protein [Dehalococcoidia bacterium]